MKRYLSISKHAVQANREGGRYPPIRIEDEATGTGFAMQAHIQGESRLVYRPGRPRDGGAELWLETEAPVVPEEAPEFPSVELACELAPESELHRLRSSGLLPRARATLERALEARPGDPLLLRRLADVLRQEGRLEEALEVCRRLLQAAPGDAAARRLVELLQEAAPGAAPAWPTPFLRLPGLLSEDEIEDLRRHVREHRGSFGDTPVLVNGVKRLRRDVRKAVNLWELGPAARTLLPRLEERLPELLDRFRLPRGPLRIRDAKITRYGDGSYFRPHVDRGPGVEDRLLGFIWYFWFPPRRFEGGELAVYDREADTGARAATCTVLAPRYNDVAVIPADCWHEVLHVSCPGDDFESARFTVNGWICPA